MFDEVISQCHVQVISQGPRVPMCSRKSSPRAQFQSSPGTMFQSSPRVLFQPSQRALFQSPPGTMFFSSPKAIFHSYNALTQWYLCLPISKHWVSISSEQLNKVHSSLFPCFRNQHLCFSHNVTHECSLHSYPDVI